jgi:hypothetical protein
MSWSSGSQLFSEIILTLRETVTDYETRVEIYNKLIGIFEDRDCDTLSECLDEDRAFDDAYFEQYPDENLSEVYEYSDEEYEE